MAVWKKVRTARMSAFFMGSSLSSMVARTRVRGGIRHSDEFSVGQEVGQPGGAARGPDAHADSEPHRLRPGPLELVDPLVEALVALPPPSGLGSSVREERLQVRLDLFHSVLQRRDAVVKGLPAVRFELLGDVRQNSPGVLNLVDRLPDLPRRPGAGDDGDEKPGRTEDYL